MALLLLLGGVPTTAFAQTDEPSVPLGDGGLAVDLAPLGSGGLLDLVSEIPPGDFSNPPDPALDLPPIEPKPIEFPEPLPSPSDDLNSPDPSPLAVELVSERSEFVRVWLEPDGSKLAEIRTEPIFFENALGAWTEFDTRLAAGLTGGFVNGVGPFEVKFADSAGASDTVVFSHGSEWISMGTGWAGASRATIGDSKITYPAVAPGVDLTYEVRKLGVKTLVILHSSSVPTAFSFDLEVSVGIKSVILAEDGRIEFGGSDGTVLFSIAPPLAWDSASEPEVTSATYKLEPAESGWTLEVALDPAWLSDPKRVFPVTLDPYIELGRGSDDNDGYIKSGAPNSSFNYSVLPLTPPNSMLVGFFDSANGVAEIYQRYPSFFQVAGKSISDADWWIYFNDPSGTAPRSQISVNAVGTDLFWFPSTLTWSGWHPPNLTSAVPLLDGPTVDNWWGADVTYPVQNFAVETPGWGEITSAGFRITGPSTGWQRVAALENPDTYDAHVNVWYSEPPTAALSSPANGSTLSNLTPTLSATVSDPEGASVHEFFVVCLDSAGNSCVWQGPASTVASGTSVSDAVPAGTLSWSTTYYWFVVVSDNGWNGAWLRGGWQFTTPPDPTPPAPPPSNPVSPAQDAVVASVAPTLTSTAVSDPNGPVSYWFRIATGTDGSSGQQLNSGWLTSPSWTVPSGFLKDGLAYTWKVFTMTPGSDQAVGSVGKFSLNLRMGNQPGMPYDTVGPVSVNLFNGNLVVNAASPSFATVGGPIGLSYQYNSRAPAPAGLNGVYYYDTDLGRDFDSTEALLSRRDANVVFNWGAGGPDPAVRAPSAAVAATDNYLVSWSGFVAVPQAGGTPQQVTYEFGADLDINDTVKIWVNTPVTNPAQLDNWSAPLSAASTLWGSAVTLTEGQAVPITIQWADGTGNGKMVLRARKVGETGLEVPASWLSASVSELSPGWSLNAGTTANPQYLLARTSEGSVALVDVSGAAHTYKKGTGNTFTPPNGETGVLAYDETGKLTLRGDDGFHYVFDASGNVASVTLPVDDRRPAAAQYVWSGTPSRLDLVTDPVSGRVIDLRYQGQAGVTCPTPPSGFDSAAPPNALCEVVYWDGTSTRYFYVGKNLARIEDPGGEVTDFSYDGNGLLSKVRDPLQADAVAAGVAPNDDTSLTLVAYSVGKVSSVALAAPNGSGGDGEPGSLLRLLGPGDLGPGPDRGHLDLQLAGG